MDNHRDMTKRSTRKYKVGDKEHDVPVMVYRCSRCGNELHEDDLPEPPEEVEGTLHWVRFDISPVCSHSLPYTMLLVPKGSPK